MQSTSSEFGLFAQYSAGDFALITYKDLVDMANEKVKVLIKYKDDKNMNTHIYRTVEVEPGPQKECPKLLAINSFDIDWYATKTILDVEVL